MFNNIFKLVYNNWIDNGLPLPNGINNGIAMHNSYFLMPHEIINLMYKNNYEIKNIKPTEADETSYYIIYHHNKIRNMIGKDKWVLSEEIEEAVRNKNLKIIFLNLHESFDDIEMELKTLQNFIIKKNLNEENFYILNNNSYLSDVKYKLKSKINVFKTNWLIEYMNTTNLKNIEFVENKKFMFLLHNRVPRPHRISLLILLKKFNLLKDDIINWSLLYPQMPFYTPTYNSNNSFKIFGDDKYFVDIHSKELRPFFRELMANQKVSYYENKTEWFGDMEKHDASNWNELNTFEQSYINIITESHYSIKDVHFTEKTFRPFYCFQIPIYLASYNHIYKLKEEHPSLDLFDDLIDHSYDNEMDDVKRLEMFVNEINRLSNMTDYIREYYTKNKLRFIKNREYIESFSNNKSTFEFFKKLL